MGATFSATVLLTSTSSPPVQIPPPVSAELDDTVEVMKKIIGLKLGKVAKRIQQNYKASFDYSPELVQLIADRCTEVDTGARNVDHILNKTLLPELSAEFLSRLAENKPISKVNLNVSEDGNFVYEIS